MAVKFGDKPTITKLTEQFDRYFDPVTSRMIPGALHSNECFMLKNSSHVSQASTPISESPCSSLPLPPKSATRRYLS
jgi:hypothetical protein